MLAIFLAPVYILIQIYIIRWMIRWMGACHYLFQHTAFRVGFILLYAFIAVSPLTGFLIHNPPALHRFLKNLGNYFLGTFFYILLVIVIVDIGRLVCKYLLKASWVEKPQTFVLTGGLCAVLILGLSIYGIFHARNTQITTYEVSVDKQVEGLSRLRVALIADTHFGYSIGTSHARKMAELINQSQVDVICFAGDIFDNEYDAIEAPEELKEILKGMKSTYGAYTCWGNHDLNEPILAGFTFQTAEDASQYEDPRMEEFLTDAGIRLLNDESICIDDKFYLVGRKDASRSEKVENGRKSPEELTASLDASKPILFLDHQPKELQEIADAGADLDLCGHTHDGQLFPGNLLTSLLWENSCGYLQKDQMHNIVTSGLGVWGPNMRIGTKSEVCIIDIHLAA